MDPHLRPQPAQRVRASRAALPSLIEGARIDRQRLSSINSRQGGSRAGTERGASLQRIPEAFGLATGRITEAQEVADLIAFLLSDVAGNITGADYVIDGGMIKTL
nr:SDR family oxidoreductase [Streptomyces sp. NBC_00886]